MLQNNNLQFQLQLEPEPEQLLLNIPYRETLDRDSFFVSPANQNAIAMIDRYPDWPTQALIIIGAKGSGKTHLCKVMREKAPDILIMENIDETLDEEKLFHILNRKNEAILLTSHLYINDINLKIPDLKSRLKAQFSVEISIPDNNLIGAIITKQLYDNGIPISPSIINYIVNNAERSFSFISKLVAALIKSSQKKEKALTLTEVKAILTNL